MKRRNWLRTTIAMLTLIATVLETGFTPVSTLAAEFTNEDGIVVNNDAIEEAEQSSNDGELQMEVTRDSEEPAAEEAAPEEQPEENADLAESSQESNVVEGDTLEEAQDGETSEEAADGEVIDGEATEGNVVDGEEIVEETGNAEATEEEVFEEAEELKKEGTLSVTDSGISGSGYDEISIYVNTDDLANKDKFRVEFTGPASASYNPVLNDELDKTNGGRYDFEGLEGGDFTVRATSSDDVILSYRYNEDGYPEIVVESKPVEKILETKTLTSVDDAEIQAITGEGFERVTVNFNTEELSEKAAFKLIVESDADATVDGYDAKSGITGLDKNTGSLTIEGLEEESFTAYVISDNDEVQIKTIAEINSVEDGEATFTVDTVDTKRVYEYEDDKVKVTATLEKADAVPDDAYFSVEPLSEEDAQKYLDTLNENRDEETPEYTAENTLLYDIGFYTDESKTEEIEPEEGSVSLKVEFKKNQISEDLGVEEKQNIEVNHFIEDGSDIEAETLEVEQNGDVNTVEVVTDSFSKFAFTNNDDTVEVEFDNTKIGSETATEVLGNDAMVYGIIANYMEIHSDAETSFAVKSFYGPGGPCGVHDTSKVGDYTRYQYDVVNSVSPEGYLLKGFPVSLITSKSGVFTHESGKITETIRSESWINNYIDTLISNVSSQSTSLSGKDSVSNYDAVKNQTFNGNDVTIDVTKDNAPSGTYYIDVDQIPALKGAFQQEGKVHIIKNAGQRIVFNFGSADDITLQGYYVNGVKNDDLVNKPSTYMSLMEELIFNFYGASEGTDIYLNRFLGLMVAPGATVHVNSTSAGWIVANKVDINGGEWHFNYDRVPEPEQGGFKFDLTKRLVYDDGVFETDVPDDEWPAEGFTFKIKKYLVDDPDEVKPISLNAHAEKNPDKIPDLVDAAAPNQALPTDAEGYWTVTLTKDKKVITLQNSSDLDAQWVWDNGHTYSDTRHYMVFMYKIIEVNGNASNVTYDTDNPRYVKIFLNVDKDGDRYTFAFPEINSHWTVSQPGCQPKFPEFKNKLGIPVTAPVTISGIKKVTVEDHDDIELAVPEGKFEFELWDYKSKGNFPNVKTVDVNGQQVIQRKENVNTTDGNGNTVSTVTFDTFNLEFDKATGYNTSDGKYSPDATEAYFYFLIKETTESDDTYKVDPRVYVVKVTFNRANNSTNVTKEYYVFASEKAMKAGLGDNSTIEDLLANGESMGEGFTFTFKNTRKGEGSTDIYGQKVLLNRTKKLEADEFWFVLTEKDQVPTDDKSNWLSEAVGNEAETGNFAFMASDVDALNYDLTDLKGMTEKEFYYTVWELHTTDDGTIEGKSNITWVTRKQDVTVTVKDNRDGTLEVHNPFESPTGTRATITNKYSASGDIKFYVQKDIAGETEEEINAARAVLDGKKFKFTFVEDESNPKKNRTDAYDKVQIGVGETAEIGSLGKDENQKDILRYPTKDYAGTYNYYITEDASGFSGVIDDTRTFRIEVVVTDDENGKLTKTATAGFVDDNKEFINNETTKPTTYTNEQLETSGITIVAVFKNGYNYSPTKQHIEGKKVLIGQNGPELPLKEKIFTFNLAPYDTTEAAVDNGIVEMPQNKTAQNDSQGNFSFDDITFNKAGTYYFLVSEQDDSGKADTDDFKYSEIEYSSEQYIVTIIVDDKHDGTLEARAPKYKLAGDTSDSDGVNVFSITNKRYVPDSVTPEAFKVINDGSFSIPAGADFTFKLVEIGTGKDVESVAAINPQIADAQARQTVTAGTDGKVEFSPLTYKKSDAGVHNYAIYEVIPADATSDDNGATWKRLNSDGSSKDGYTYDGRIVTFDVTVTAKETTVDNVKKTFVEAVGVYGKSYKDTTDMAKFNNKYNATGELNFKGYKEMIGRDFVNGDKFDIVLVKVTTENGAQVKKEIARKTIDGSDLANKNELTFSFPETGTYSFDYTDDYPGKGGTTTTYEIYEDKDTSIDGVAANAKEGEDFEPLQFSTAHYYIDVTSKEENGNITFTKKIYKDSERKSLVKEEAGVDTSSGLPVFGFENITEPKGGVILQAAKSYTHGDLSKESSKFTFLVKETDDDKDDNYIVKAENDSDGKVTFDKIVYKLDDQGNITYKVGDGLLAKTGTANAVQDATDKNKWTITYYIKEKVVVNDHVVFDENVYSAVVTIVNSKNGSLTTSKEYFDPNGNTLGKDAEDNPVFPTFENVYSSSGDVKIEARKILNIIQGTETITKKSGFEPGQFKFILEGEGIKLTAAVGEDGVARFYTIGEKGEKVALSELTYDQDDIENSPTIVDDKGKVVHAKYYTLREFTPYDIPENERTGEIKSTTITLENGDEIPAAIYNGTTYDCSSYEILVTLDDDGEGNIITDWDAHRLGATQDSNQNAVQEFLQDLWENVFEFFGGTAERHKAEFTNEYKAEGRLEIGAKKTLVVLEDGKEVNIDPASGQFTFTLSGEDEAGKFDPIEVKVDKVKDQDYYGVIFGARTFTKESKKPYVYTLTEEYSGQTIGGIVYSSKVYTIEATVTDPGDGKLRVTANVTDESGAPIMSASNVKTEGGTEVISDICSIDPLDIEFKNTVDVKPITKDIEGSKELSGREMDAGEFLFAIKNVAITDDEGNTVDAGKEFAQLVKNDGDGNFKFTGIPYSYEDLKKVETTGEGEDQKTKISYVTERYFKYEIEEITPDNYNNKYASLLTDNNVTFVKKDGVNYSNATRTVVIKLYKDTDGTLKAEIVDDKSDDVSFTNTFDAAGGITFSVSKDVTNAPAVEEPNKPRKFDFVLKEINGNPIRVVEPDAENPDKIVTTTKNELTVSVADDEELPFDTMRYEFSDIKDSKVGNGYAKDFVYEVREVVPDAEKNKDAENDGGYKYTDVKYVITVSVSSDGSSNDLTVDHKVAKYILDENEEYVEDKTFTGDKIKTLPYINEYFAKGSEEIEGNKTLTGDDLTNVADDEEFKFVLYEKGEKGYAEKTDIDNTTYKEVVVENGQTVERVITQHNPVTVTAAQLKESANNKSSFKFHIDYTQDDIGTHYYKVDEIEPEDEEATGVAFDHTVYYVKVIVSNDSQDGKLTVSKSIIKDEEGKATDFVEGAQTIDGNCDFENIAVSPNSIIFTAEKDLDGIPVRPAMFTFIVSDTKGGDPLVVKDKAGNVVKDEDGNDKLLKVTNNNAGKVTFDPIHYSLADVGKAGEKTFTYYIREDVTLLDGTHFSPVEGTLTEYKVDVTVKKSGNKIVISASNNVRLNEETGIIDGIEFKNEFKDEIPVRIGGYKKVIGFKDERTDYGEYKFALFEEDNTVVEIDGYKFIETVKPTEQGKPFEFTFQKDLVYNEKTLELPGGGYSDKAVRKTYTLREVKPGDDKKYNDSDLAVTDPGNVTYDTNDYTITVDINYGKDDKNNDIITASVNTTSGISGHAPTTGNNQRLVVLDGLGFNNVDDADVVLGGIKRISGKNLDVSKDKDGNGAYTFKLTDDTEARNVIRIDEKTGRIVATGGKEQIVTNDGDSFKFDPISYSAEDAGTKVYKIKETAARDGSIIDSKEYTATVVVKVNKDTGAIEVSDPVYTDENGNTLDKLEIKNEYFAYGEKPIDGTKIMLGRAIDADEYSFILRDENNEIITDDNGDPITAKTVEAAISVDPKDKKRKAVSAFEFDAIPFDQEVLDPDKDGVYDASATKYYTVEEVVTKEIQDKGWKDKGVTYSQAVYAVQFTITPSEELITADDFAGKHVGEHKLNIEKKVIALKGDDGKETVKVVEDKSALRKFFENLFGTASSAEDEIVFKNSYRVECTIDPPIVRKEIMGRDIRPHEFQFRITGPGLPSMGETKYVREVWNGEAFDKDGKPIPVDAGEVYVGDIFYQYNEDFDDLNLGDGVEGFSKAMINGKEYSRYEYHTEEIVDNIDKSMDPTTAKLTLVVYVRDDGEGHLEILNDNGVVVQFDKEGHLIKDAPNTPEKDKKSLFWHQDSENKVEVYAKDENGNPILDENGNPVMADMVNIFNQEGSAYLKGIKKMDGRELTEADMANFNFVIEEIDNPKHNAAELKHTALASKKMDKYNDIKQIVVEFNGGEGGIDFLNYRYGAFDDNKDDVYEIVDDTGDYVYLITEEEYNKDGIESSTDKFEIHISVTPVVDENGTPIVDEHHHGQLKTDVTQIYQILSDNNKIPYSDQEDLNLLDTKFEFTNKYRAKASLEFEGVKYLIDQQGELVTTNDALDGQYEFALYQYKSEESRNSEARGELIDNAITDAKGNFKLTVNGGYDQYLFKENLGYSTEPKKLFYKIVEVTPSYGKMVDGVFESDGIVYDNTRYLVDVTVTDDKKGDLKTETTVTDAKTGKVIATGSGEKLISKISFTNQEKLYTSIEGQKHWVVEDTIHPDVILDLYSSAVDGGKTVINTATIVYPDLTYRFVRDKWGNKLPIFDKNGKVITYNVVERAIAGRNYLVEYDGFDIYNTEGKIRIRKIDAETGAGLSGATLAILDGSTEVDRWVTGVSAHVVKDGLLTAGKTYTLREITAPEGYDKAPDQTFTVPTDGSDITLTMADPPIIGSVRLTKRDETTREELAGAEFALYTSDGSRIYATGTVGSYRATNLTSNGIFITDATGHLTITDLPYGTYYFVETRSPDGYLMSSERLGFTILRSGQLVEVTFNDPKSLGSVRLRKVNETGTRSLAGAVFELYSSKPRTVGQAAVSTIFSDAYFRYGTYRTNADGEIYVDGLPWDDYYFIEVDAPDGYTVARDVNGDDLVYVFSIDRYTSGRVIDLGDIVNNPTTPPPPTVTPTPPPTTTTPPPVITTTTTPRGVLGERADRIEKGGVVNGVLGVRAKPSSGVLGARVGPVTGDTSNIILWLLLLCACVATIVATIMTGKKKKTGTK